MFAKMFGTIRYDKDTNSRKHVELQSASGFKARGLDHFFQHYGLGHTGRGLIFTSLLRNDEDEYLLTSPQLKCSGDKDGCGKCQAASVTCMYRDILSIKDSRKTSKRVRPSNNHLPTPNSCQASYGSQQLSIGAEIDQESTQSMSDSEPLNLPCSSSEEFAELNNIHSSTNAENIFDAVLNIQVPYHHTNTPSQPTRFNENTQERRSEWSSFPGGNSPSPLGTNREPASKCDCLRDVALFLEAIGVESTETRADILLKVRGDNGMFLAVVLQQLVTLTRTASDKLLEWNHEQSNRRGSSSETHIPIVCIYQYRIEIPDVKVSLILHVALLHFFGLQGLSNALKEKLRSNSFAAQLVTDCESIIVDTIKIIQEKASNSASMGSAF
ncbi:hypothetical protein TRV_00062 [Trichophyton verrucosum HKI 0517]|uniref:Uncharacterized protein n=1 Tax=Trichophyton verrucosum (strain HKI 0517) TaxID=663202 RepID=D4CZ25_TRIVH|nr:uncharacterized protein TRV_00062 [Trichophyton verrucosum HKI 0517]EFE45124.1 hypothetical protein TRV_00062 [Trichophyton verrucosum HKI 0517]